MPDPTIMSADLAGSVRQDVPRAAVPMGSLWNATNVRRTMGGWRKRHTYVSAGTTTSGVTGQSNLASPAHFVADFDGRHVIANNLRVTQRTGSNRPWQDSGRVARYKPERTDEVASGNLVGTEDTAATGRFVAVAYATQGTANRVYFEVRDIQANVVVFRFNASGAVHPRVINIGDRFIFAYIETGGNTVLVYQMDMYTLPWTLNGPTTIGTIFNAADRFDIAPHDTTSNFIIAFRVGATTMQVWTRNALLGAVATRTFACTNENYPDVAVAGSSGGIWVCYINSAGTVLRGAVLNAALTATTTTETAIADTLTTLARLSLTVRSTTTVWLAVDGTDSNVPKINWGNLDTALFFTRNDLWGLFLKSYPVHLNTTEIFVWVCSGRALNSDVTFGPPFLVRLTNGTGITDRLRRAELISDRKAFAGVSLPRVGTSSGDGLETKQWVALNTYDYFSAANPTENVTLHSYTDVTGSYPATELDYATSDRTLYASGGIVQEVTDALPWNSSIVLMGAENSFVVPPYVAGIGSTTGGSLTAGQLYQACIVWEYVDSQGRRTQSAPSNIESFTIGVGDSALTMTIDPLSISDRFYRDGGGVSAADGGGALQAVVYVTGPGGSIFYRNRVIPKQTFMVEAASWTTTVTAVDESEEIIYIQSVSSFANYPAPACRRIWQGGGRVWVGGLFSPREIECSRILRKGEPACFTRAPQFRIQFPEDINDGHFTDGACVVLTNTGIFIVNGEGPQNDGSNPFLTPTRVTSDVGGSRFLAEVPAGLLFQSDRGVFLLPRGFGAPVFIGARFQQSLGSKTIVGACLNGFTAADQNGERCVGISLSDGHVLVLDADTLEFISDDTPEDLLSVTACGTWDGKFVLAGSTAGGFFPYTQNTSAFVSTPATLTTGWIAPFGSLGRGHIRRILTRAELRATDASGSLNTNISLVMTPDSTALYGNAATQDLNTGITGTAGDMIIVESNPPFQQCNALSLAWTISGNGEAVRLTGFGLEGQGDPGGAKVQPTLRTA